MFYKYVLDIKVHVLMIWMLCYQLFPDAEWVTKESKFNLFTFRVVLQVQGCFLCFLLSS